jgi:hypothetical protein
MTTAVPAPIEDGKAAESTKTNISAFQKLL